MIKRVLFIVSLIWLFGIGDAHAGSAGSYCMSSEESKFIFLINKLREDKGLVRLVTSQSLGAAAEHHSIDMGKYNEFGHSLHDGTTWNKNITNHGYPADTFRGENIAAGHPLAQHTFDQFLNSPGHLDNMLNPRWRVIGIGRIYDDDAQWTWYWTTTFGDTRYDKDYACLT